MTVTLTRAEAVTVLSVARAETTAQTPGLPASRVHSRSAEEQAVMGVSATAEPRAPGPSAMHSVAARAETAETSSSATTIPNSPARLKNPPEMRIAAPLSCCRAAARSVFWPFPSAPERVWEGPDNPGTDTRGQITGVDPNMPMIDTATGRIAFSHNHVDPAGRTAVVLVHGAGGQRADWPRQWTITATGLGGAPVYAPDLPGHGKSDGPGLDTVEAYADAVAGFIGAAGLKRVVVAGHSMGAAIALELATRRDPRLAGIVMISGAASFKVADALLQGFLTAFEPTISAVVSYSWNNMAQESYRRQQLWHAEVAGAQVVRDDFLACQRYNATERLGEAAVPVLLMGSPGDRMVRFSALRATAEGLKDARVVSIPNCGHFPQVEQRGKCATAITKFLAEIG